jgi:hypothetical protein
MTQNATIEAFQPPHGRVGFLKRFSRKGPAMAFTLEFPDFPEKDMPAIPAGFEDASWHNDACPSFFSPTLQAVLFVDFLDPALREFPETLRFGLYPATAEGLRLGAEIMESDDWNAILAAIVARAFAIGLKASLSAEDLAEVVRRNRTADYADASLCASHDFCDANMVMYPAITAVLGRDVLAETMADDDAAIWNEAWKLAKAFDFWIGEN